MKVYKKPEAVVVEFSVLEAITDIPGMGGGVIDGSGSDMEDEE